MNENVDKERNKRSFLCRQTIQQTLSYPVHPALRSQRTLAREIAFAKEIILPGHAHPRAAVRSKVKCQARCKDVSINPLDKGASRSNSNTQTIYLNDKDYEKWEVQIENAVQTIKTMRLFAVERKILNDNQKKLIRVVLKTTFIQSTFIDS